VVKDQPDVNKAPVPVRRLLKKCLEKDPKKQLRDIGDAWELLEDEARRRTGVLSTRRPNAIAQSTPAAKDPIPVMEHEPVEVSGARTERN
jgi:hypothetical protein